MKSSKEEKEEGEGVGVGKVGGEQEWVRRGKHKKKEEIKTEKGCEG